MAAPEQMTRQELLEARERVLEQLHALRTPMDAKDYLGNGPIVSDLESILAEIEAELSESKRA